MLPEVNVALCWRPRVTSYELGGGEFFNDSRHAGHYLYCYTSKPNNSTSQKVDNYKNSDDFNSDRSTVCAHCWLGNSACLLTSREAILTNRVQTNDSNKMARKIDR